MQPINTREKLEKRFEDLIRRLEDASMEVNSGRLGDFETLNRDIADISLDVQKSPPETARALQPQMGKVIARLDELAAAILAYKNRLTENQA